jgi:hypothetical protein
MATHGTDDHRQNRTYVATLQRFLRKFRLRVGWQQRKRLWSHDLASTFQSIMGDEEGHHQTFSTELLQLNGGH